MAMPKSRLKTERFRGKVTQLLLILSLSILGNSGVNCNGMGTSTDGPSAPQNFTLSSASATTLLASWSPPADPNGEITGYMIDCTPPMEGISFMADGSETSSTLMDLDPFTEYTCTVTASTTSGAGNCSEPDTLTTLEDTPDAVTGVMLMFDSASVANAANGMISVSVTVTWTASSMPNGVITSHDVTIQNSAGTTTFDSGFLAAGATDYTQTITLAPNEIYLATVTVTNSAGSSESNSSLVSSPEGTPDAVTNINLMFDTSTGIFNSTSRILRISATISWTAPAELYGVLQQYSVSVISSDGVSVYTNESVDPSTTSVSDTLMVFPFEVYTVTVNATTGGGTSSSSTTVTSPQAVPSAVTNVVLMYESSSVSNEANGMISVSVTVTWTASSMPNGVITSHSVTIRNSAGTFTFDSALLAASATEYTQTVTLAPNEMYLATVTVTNGAGSSQRNSSLVTSPQGTPDPVTNIDLMFETSTATFNSVSRVLTVSATISWTAPAELYGVLQQYSVSVTSSDGVSVYTDESVDPSTTSVSPTLMVVPFERYTVTVNAITGGGTSSDSRNVTSPEREPRPVQQLSASVNGPTSITISWNRPEFENGVIARYEISISSDSLTASGQENLNHTELTSLSYTAENLSPFTNYTFEVAAVTGGGRGESVSITTPTDEDAPSEPLNVMAMNSSNMSIIVSWTMPSMSNGVIRGYTVTYFVTDSIMDDMTQQNVSAATTQTEIMGLEIFTNYTVFVEAFTVLVGEGSEAITVVTDEGVPTAVRDLMRDDVNATAIMVSFLPPEPANGIITSYEIFYVRWASGSIVGSEGPPRVLDPADFIGEDRITDIISGLEAFTEYRIRVRANTRAGAGDVAVVLVNTDPSAASKPTSFTISEVTSDSVTLTWNFPDTPRGLIAGYLIRYSLSSVIDNSTEVNVTLSTAGDTSPQSRTVMNLLPFTSYQFTVKAYSFNDSSFIHLGEESETLTVTTDEADPVAVTDVGLMFGSSVTNEADGMISVSVTVTWTASSMPNGNITSHNVTIRNSAGTVTFDSGFLADDATSYSMMITLAPNEMYLATVAVTNGAGSSESNSSLALSPRGMPVPVSNIVVSFVEEDSTFNSNTGILTVPVSISWTAPVELYGGVLQQYSVAVETSMSISVYENTSVDPSITSITTTLMVQPFEAYIVTVDASISGAVASNSITVTSPEAAPVAVTDVVLTFDSSSVANEANGMISVLVMVTWTASSMPNGNILSHNITVFGSTGTAVFSSDLLASDAVMHLERVTLEPNQMYRATVQITNSADSNRATSIFTLSPQGTPDAVTNIDLMFETSTGTFNSTSRILTIPATISWTAPAELYGDLQQYSVSVTSSSGALVYTNESVDPLTTSVSETLVVFPFEVYTVTVNATTGGGTSSSSTDVTSPETVSSPPLNLTVTSVGPRDANISWSVPAFPNGDIQLYSIAITPGGMAINTSDASTTFMLSALIPFTGYSVSVRAVSTVVGEMSEVQIFTTAEDIPSDVRNLVISYDTENLTISWDEPSEPNGNISYITRVYCQDLFSNSVLIDNTERVFSTGLFETLRQPFTLCSVTVVPQTGAGNGSSSMMSFQTPEEAPTEVLNLALSFNGTHFIITWEQPVEPNGNLSYSVSLVENSLVTMAEEVLGSRVVRGTQVIFESTGQAHAQYTATVTPQTGGGDGPMSTAIFTTPQQTPSNVPEVNVVVLADSIRVTWEEPLFPNGEVEYDVTLQQTNLARPDDVIQNLTEVTLNLESTFSLVVRAYYRYTATVIPFTADPVRGDPTVAFNETEQGTPSDVPEVTLTESTNDILVTWVEPEFLNGEVQYEVTLQQMNLARPEDVIPSLVQVTAELMFTFSAVVQPYHRYSATVIPSSDDPVRGNPTDGFIITAEEAPTEVLNLNLSFNDTHFIITWDQPAEPNGNLTYNVSLVGDSLATMMPVLPVSRVVRDTQVVFTWIGEAYTLYTATVTPQTGGGSGPISTTNFTTPQQTPSDVPDVNVTEVVTGLLITWEEPVLPNGEVQYEVTLQQMNLARPENMLQSFSETTPQLEVTFTVDIQPYHRYMVTVVPFTAAPDRGSPTSASIQTNEEIPSDVEMINLCSNDTHITANWTEPEFPNGNLSYVLNLTNVSLLEVEQSTFIIQDSVTRMTIVVVEFAVKFYSRYSITLYPVTGAGRGSTSVASFDTPQGVPSVPRNLMVMLVGLQLDATWTPPECPNGIVSYEINIMLTDLATNEVEDLALALSRNSSYRLVMLSVDDEAFVRYDVSVRASTVAGESEAAVASHTTPEGPSEAVEGLQAYPSITSVAIEWDPPIDANGIITSYQAVLFDSTGQIANMTVNESVRMIEFSGLMPHVNHSVTVRPFTGNGDIPGDAADVTFFTDIGVPSVPRDVTASPQGMAGTIVVTWTQPLPLNAPTVNYTVLIGIVANLPVDRLEFMTEYDELSYTVTGLRPFTNYSVAVQACSEVDCGPESELIFVVTLEEAPSAPLNFTVSTVPGSPTQLQADWTEPEYPNGVIQNYTVVCNGGSVIQIFGEMEFSVMLTDLQPFTQYQCVVFATNNGDRGSDSDASGARTDEGIPAAVTDVVLTFESSSVANAANGMISVSVTVTWTVSSMPNGVITSHSVTIFSNATGTNVYSSELLSESAMMHSMTVTLEPNERYFATVEVTNGAGSSEGNSDLSLSPQGMPDAVTDIMFATSTESFDSSSRILTVSATISWTAPAELYGVLVQYSVSVTSSDGVSVYTDESVDPLTTSVSDTLMVFPFEVYTVTVNATTGGGTSSNSITVTSPEAVPEAVTNVVLMFDESSVTNAANGMISVSTTVTWMASSMPNGVITSHSVTILRTAGTVVYSSDLLGDTATMHTMTVTLEPNEMYFATVEVTNGAGSSQANSSVTESPQGMPDAVSNIVMVFDENERNFNSANRVLTILATISWTAPAELYGDLEQYSVSVTGSDGVFVYTNESVDPLTTSVSDTLMVVPFEVYTVTVNATTGGGTSSNSRTVTSPETEPGPVQQLIALVNGPTSITLSWSRPEFANGIIARYEIGISSDSLEALGQGNFDHTELTSLSFTVDNLSPFTTYTFVVVAVTGGGRGESVLVTNLTNEGAPSEPMNVMAMNSSSMSITVSWTIPSVRNGVIRGYTVTYFVTSSEMGDMTQQNVTTTATQIEIMGLEIFTNYTVFVEAFTVVVGNRSEIVTVVTDEDVPGPVANLQVLDINSTALMVTFDPPTRQNGVLTRYTISYIPASDIGSASESIQLEPTDTDEIIANLSSFTRYRVTVVAHTRIGPGEEATGFAITDPSASSPPTNFMAVTTASNYVLLSWGFPEEPRGNIEGYILEYSLTSDQENLERRNITLPMDNDDSTQMLNVTGLLTFRSYRFMVRAYSFGDDFFLHRGVDSLLEITTAQTTPAAVTDVVLVFDSDSVTNADNGMISVSVTVTWTASSMPNGDITSHEVTIRNSTGTITFDSGFLADDATSYSMMVTLAPNEMYLATVTVTNGADSSRTDSNLVISPQGTPDAVGNLELTFDEGTRSFDRESRMLTITATISWSIPVQFYGVFDQYSVSVTRTSTPVYTNTLMDQSTTSVSPPLMVLPSEVYTVTVNVTTGGGTSSSNIMVTSPEAAPSPPLNVNTNSVGPRGATISWSQPAFPNGIIQFYTITYSSSSGIEMENTTGNSTTFMLDSLTPFTSYSVRVRAVNRFIGEDSSLLDFTTAEDIPTSVINLRIVDGDGNIFVSWEEPVESNGNISYIRTVFCQNLFDDSIITDETLNVTSTGPFQFPRQPFMLCRVAVTPQTGAGRGTTSMTSLQTPEEEPSEVLNVNLSFNDNQFIVTWDQPLSPNGNLNYTVSLVGNSLVTMTEVFSESRVVRDTQAVFASAGAAHTLYTATVTPQTGAGSGSAAQDTFTTPQQMPSDVTNVVLRLLDNEVRISWDEPVFPNGEVRYEVTLQQMNLARPESMLQNLTSVTSQLELVFEVSVLPYHSYTAMVVPFTNATERGNVAVSATVSSAQDTPSDVLTVTVTEVDVGIQVTWEEPVLPNGEVQYEVTLQQVNLARPESILQNFNETTTQLEATFSFGVQPYHRYTATVVPFTDDPVRGNSTINSYVSAQGAPSEVPRVTVMVGEMMDRISITWEEPMLPNGVVQYSVTLRQTDLARPEIELDNFTHVTTERSHTFMLTVQPHYRYTATVVPFTNQGEQLNGPSTNSSTATDQEMPESPEMVDVVVTAFNTANVTWSPPNAPNGIITRYYVTYSPTDQENARMEVMLNGTSRGVTLTGLTGNTDYTLTVSAATVVGRGSPSMPSNFKTLAGPSPPSTEILTLEQDRLDLISPKPPAASNGESEPATSSSFQVEFSIIPEMEVNGRVERFFIFVRPQLSKNNSTATYYVSSRAAPESAPQYAALERMVERGNSRKRQADEPLPQSVQIGGSQNCEPDTDPCNGPLKAGTSYQVRYRLVSENGEETDYPFFSGAFTTSNDDTVIIAGSVAVTIVIVILIIVLVAVVMGILYNRKKTGKMEVSLYADDESRPPLLQPPEDSIVPLETKKSPVAVNGRFQMHSTQANTKKIYIKDFAHHLQSMLDDSGYKFSEEYERVTEIGLDHAKEASLQAENRAKNRYTNILAYDHSRVKLSFVDDEPGSDYINACYIPGHRMRRAYIATQGPLPATFDDFWRMVWEQNSHIIVMLTQLVERGRTKCHRYWPGTEPIVYGDIAVEMLSEKEKEDWTVREFKLSLDEKRHRIVRHFQFTSWPDHGVPDNPVAAVDFVKIVRCFIEPFHGPIVSHCSAGVGRTGCFIALDNLVLHIKDHDWVDIFGLACEMRQHRNHMIQTEAQYIFIHKAMLEIVDSMTSYNRNGTTGSHYSQSGGYPTLFINRYVETEENMTQMSDYYGECLSEETHM